MVALAARNCRLLMGVAFDIPLLTRSAFSNISLLHSFLALSCSNTDALLTIGLCCAAGESTCVCILATHVQCNGLFTVVVVVCVVGAVVSAVNVAIVGVVWALSFRTFRLFFRRW